MQTLTKTATYNASEIAAQVAGLASLSPADRYEARQSLKADAQRAWKRAGRIGPSPAVFF